MRSGYSHDLVVFLQTVDPSRPAARLGRVCVERDISVRTLAARLGVSRQTVYNWFWARYEPRVDQLQSVERLLQEIEPQEEQSEPA